MAISGAQLFMVNLDCSDPRAMAAFYAEVLDWPTAHSEADYAMVSNGSVSIGFGRVEGYRAPEWPDSDHGKRYHLDVQVPDLDEAVAACRAAGAKVPEFQPGDDRWTVLLDPEGHPFCLFPKKNED